MILRMTLITVVAGIAYLSLTPTETITIGNDKISHFIAYGALSFNVGLLTYSRKWFLPALLCCVIYGGLIEVGQYYVPGRFMSGYDILANTAGVVLGGVLSAILYGLIKDNLPFLRLK